MTDSMKRTIMECGFVPPGTEFVKTHPKGKEYGYYVVTESINADPASREIRVIKRDRIGMLEWACKFDEQVSFGNWAKHNT